MKFVSLHTKNTAIIYKNSLCSTASILVLIFVVLSVMIPFLLVSLLSPYSGIAESRVLYEQPRLQFKFQHLFVGELASTATTESQSSLVACSTFANFNERLQDFGKYCEGVKFWTEDLDHDHVIDRAYFQLELNALPARLESLDLLLFFEAKLKHKCSLTPPALLTQQLVLPSKAQLRTGSIRIKAELELKQYIEFTCPFPGRTTKTHFRHIQLNTNVSSSGDGDSIAQFRMESLLQQLKANPAFFQLAVQETYYEREAGNNLRIQLEVDVLQVPARYHLSVWERLGQFWLYFASFFGISFYIMNKLKDFLFGQHIIRAFEIIPWKKLY